MTPCPGGERCLKCDVKPVDCATIYRAQRESLFAVYDGKVKADEALKNMADRFPGKTIREAIKR